MAEIKFNGEINFEELMEFACKGIEAEVREKEKTVLKGKRLIHQIELGEEVKTKKTISEIKKIVRDREREIEELWKKRDNYKWELALKSVEEAE